MAPRLLLFVVRALIHSNNDVAGKNNYTWNYQVADAMNAPSWTPWADHFITVFWSQIKDEEKSENKWTRKEIKKHTNSNSHIWDNLKRNA